MTRIRRRTFTLTVSVLGVLMVLASAGRSLAVDAEAAARWREDLDFARSRLIEVHPDVDRNLPADQLDARFAALSARLADLEPFEIAVGLAEVVAALGDGHTRLTLPLPEAADFVEGHSSTQAPSDPGLGFHTLPIRLGAYREGLFVERIESSHAAWAGARVIAIGGVPIERAFEAVAPVIRHDNEMQLLDLMPMHLVIPEVLAARGLAPSRSGARFTLEDARGAQTELELRASVDETAVRWSSALAALPARALSLKHLLPGRAPRRGSFARENWFERVPESRAIYFQYNRVEDQEDETVAALAARLRAELATGEIDRLVIDLRWNWGGDNSFNLPLLHALIASDALRQPGALVVLIGRGTFSAAMMFALSLEQHLGPVFVGEPSGSSPNHTGDSRKFRLPNSNLTLRISTLDWQLSDPRDERVAIAAEIAAPPSWSELGAGRDGALEIALAPERPIGSVTGDWLGTISVPYQELAVELRIAVVGSAELKLEEIPETMTLVPVASGARRLELAGASPFGPIRLQLVRFGDRLAGRLIRDSRAWRSMAIGLARAASPAQ